MSDKKLEICRKKTTYFNKIQAEIALAKLKRLTNSQVKQIYRCPCCGKFHLTSKEGRGK